MEEVGRGSSVNPVRTTVVPSPADWAIAGGSAVGVTIAVPAVRSSAAGEIRTVPEQRLRLECVAGSWIDGAARVVGTIHIACPRVARASYSG